MLLPNCLCQFLQPFGVEIFHQEAKAFEFSAAGDKGAPTTPEDLDFGNVPEPFAPPVLCHCDEACNKVSDGNCESDDSISTTHALCMVSVRFDPPSSDRQFSPLTHQVRPPPLTRDLQAELCLLLV